jgi:hypothetical protein
MRQVLMNKAEREEPGPNLRALKKLGEQERLVGLEPLPSFPLPLSGSLQYPTCRAWANVSEFLFLQLQQPRVEHC